VDASAVTAQRIVFFADAGINDTFIGGSGNDTVFIAPFRLTSADTFQGGAGIDSFYLSATFSFNPLDFSIIPASAFTNVTGFENLFLGTAGDFVTLTNNLVAGTSIGYFGVTDSDTSDRVDASAVTATPIVFFASSGSDTFIGGSGNDAVYIATTNLTSDDTLRGGLGIDNLYFTTGGTVAAAAFTNVTGFEALVLNGTGNNVTLTNDLVAGSDIGVLVVAGGAGNDIVDGSGITNGGAIQVFGNGGADTFTGGNGANAYAFAATDLTSSDTVHGGAGIDSLIITTAGTLAASAFTNVTGVEALVLANGTNSVSLSDSLVADTSLGYFIVRDGAGNDTIDASGVTNGTSIAIYGTNGGTETFTGGNGNDSFLFAGGQLTAADAVAGGGGADTLWMTTAGTTAAADLAGISGIEAVYLQNGGSFALANGITAAAALVAVGSGAVDTFDASAVTGYGVRFSGNGGADVLRGGSQDDTFFIGDSAFATIDGNGGTTDRITLTVVSQVFDLTANAGKISDIEVIDLTRASAASLNLAGTDIALVNSSGNSLYVVGDSDDTVSAGSGFTLIASGVVNNAVAAGHTFEEYQHSSGSLLFVDSGVLLV
jgi:Ca2+-binding RTX toxin-like protein